MIKALSQEEGGLISAPLPSPRHPDFLLSGEREGCLQCQKKLHSPGAELCQICNKLERKPRTNTSLLGHINEVGVT